MVLKSNLGHFNTLQGIGAKQLFLQVTMPDIKDYLNSYQSTLDLLLILFIYTPIFRFRLRFLSSKIKII